MSIFDPGKAPKADSLSSDLSTYGEEAIGILLAQYESEKSAEILHGNLISREAIIISDITTEWKMYHQLV